MKQFFKFMFASMIGFILSFVLFIFIVGALISAMVSSATSDDAARVEKNSVLHVYFKSPITDRTSKNPFENFDFTNFKSTAQPGLNDIIRSIDKAAADDNIDGIYLDLSNLQGGMASIEEIRNSLLEFKKSKKFILAYADYYSQSAYYLASVADQVWVNPEGVVDFRGISAKIPFVKGLLAKLEVEPQVIRHGKFKSAIEPFILDKMSDENREQTATFVEGFWNHYVNNIAEARKTDPVMLNRIADSMLVQTAEDALNYKLVDKIGYMDEFIGVMNSRSDKDHDAKPELISLKKYTRVASKVKKEFTRDKIAVIYASGNIVGGKGNADEIGSETLSETIRKARLDDKVKAIVLRVNSPGGDALASEVIWREMDISRKVKPVIVSMGDVAASGGYYISCAADTIVAQPNTITGSIGVFGLLFNAQKLFNNKLGITFDTYKTGEFADLGTPTRPLTEAERKIIQNSVENVYTTFVRRVSEGRSISTEGVDEIGQGRVWTGNDAKSKGLVDIMGGLEDAIAIAAKKAKLDNYRVSEMPEEKEAFQQIMEELSDDVETRWLKYRLGGMYDFYIQAQNVMSMDGVQARMMTIIDFD